MEPNRYQRGSIFLLGKGENRTWYGIFREDVRVRGKIARKQRKVRIGKLAEVPTKNAADFYRPDGTGNHRVAIPAGVENPRLLSVVPYRTCPDFLAFLVPETLLYPKTGVFRLRLLLFAPEFSFLMCNLLRTTRCFRRKSFFWRYHPTLQ